MVRLYEQGIPAWSYMSTLFIFILFYSVTIRGGKITNTINYFYCWTLGKNILNFVFIWLCPVLEDGAFSVLFQCIFPRTVSG